MSSKKVSELSINELSNVMEEIANKIINRVLGEFKKEMALFRNELSAHTNKLDDLEIKLAMTEKKVKTLEEKFIFNADFNERQNNLLVNGIPRSENENVSGLVKTVAAALGMEDVPACRYYRFKGANDAKSPILINFNAIGDKNEFLQRYMKECRHLTLEKVLKKAGDTSRIYIQQDLSKPQYQILKEAVKQKNEKKIHQFSMTPHGFKISYGNGITTTVTSVTELMKNSNRKHNNA